MYSSLPNTAAASPSPRDRHERPHPDVAPEVLLGPQPADQPSLALTSEGVQRYIWNSTYGAVLIEVRDGVAYVNGKRVTSIEELRAPPVV